jgi:pyruvyltransferase
MPLIYDPGNPEKEYEVSVILHHRTNRVADNSDDAEKYEISISDELTEKYHLHFIDPKTADYQFFIDELAKSKKVIASSLHGIILAEAYGVPTVFLNWGMDDQPIKFHDWYLSTGREMECSKSMEEALDAAPMPVPDLRAMREALLNSFPYDLWEE